MGVVGVGESSLLSASLQKEFQMQDHALFDLCVPGTWGT
jgi:hypothetical protein